MNEFRNRIKREIEEDIYSANLRSLYVFSWDKKFTKIISSFSKKEIDTIIKKIPRKKQISSIDELFKIVEHVISNRNNHL